MSLRSSLRVLLLISVSSSFLNAQFVANPLNRELRAAWIATVANIDWPLPGVYTTLQQKSDMRDMFDSLARVGINSVFFQIRPSCDALYKSQLEPWSQWLTGTQGLAPTDTSYDPLLEAIAYARLYGMELHAWFNPYRAVVSTASSSVAPSHISVIHPEWVLTFGTLKMLDPGLPAVREYVTGVIMDVVRRYDIDGVHFDDYFYPYSGVTTEDDASFAAHNPQGLPRNDWRRDNVNKLISMLHDSINAVKHRVKFGVSPFGIWRTTASDPTGSNVSPGATESYDDLYADSRRWLQEGWVDYMAPQVYWRQGYAIANYSVLLPWWNANAFGRHIYIGQATYRMFGQDNWPAWEITQQIGLNRQQTNVYGSIHFSAKYFAQQQYGSRKLNDSLRALSYTHRVLRPTMAWKDAVPPLPPESLTIDKYSSFGLVKWKPPALASDSEGATGYLMYTSKSLPINFSDIRNARFMGTMTSWAEGTNVLYPEETIYFAVTALDRLQNESAPSNIMGLRKDGTVGVDGEKLIPAHFTLSQNFPNPFNPVTFIGFEVPYESMVTLKVYDVLGREVATLIEGLVGSGYRQVTFDGSGLRSGTYFYRLTAGGAVTTKKMQLVK